MPWQRLAPSFVHIRVHGHYITHCGPLQALRAPPHQPLSPSHPCPALSSGPHVPCSMTVVRLNTTGVVILESVGLIWNHWPALISIVNWWLYITLCRLVLVD